MGATTAGNPRQTPDNDFPPRPVESDGPNGHTRPLWFEARSFTCTQIPGDAGRIPDLKPTFVRDGAKLYGLAKQNGATYLAQGYTIQLGTAAAPSDRHATWNISFSKDNKNAPVTIIIDANTGVVEKVIKD